MSSLFCSSQTNDDDQQIIIISFDAFAIPGRSACHLPVGRKLKSNVTLKSSRRRREVSLHSLEFTHRTTLLLLLLLLPSFSTKCQKIKCTQCD